MIGHGSPASFASALARAAFAVCALVALSSSARAVPTDEATLLRITWGGGEATRWTGQIGVDNGTLSSLRILSDEPDAAGSVWLENTRLRVACISRHRHDAIEVALKSGPAAKLQIELAADDKSPTPQLPQRLEIPVADLPRRPYQVRLDNRGNTLEIQIVTRNQLQITAQRNPLIFSPGEHCLFDLATAIPNLTPGTRLAIQTTLTPARHRDGLWEGNQHLEVPVEGSPKVSLDVPLPNSEGVYTIHIVASRPSGFDRFWASTARLAERSFEVVVLDSTPAANAPAGKWESVLEIDPTNPRWVDLMPGWTQLQRIPGLNHGALGNVRALNADPRYGPFVELPPTPVNGEPFWQAYSLPLRDVAVPHMLEIDCHGQTEHSLGISIVEPNANGVLTGANCDSGVFFEGFGRGEAAQTQTHRMVFWPRTQAPLLLLTNQSPASAAMYGQIRVFKRSSNRLAPSGSDNPTHSRLVTAYISRPNLSETFGVSPGSDPWIVAFNPVADCVIDGKSTYDCATRLADYLRYSGYNSAIVTIPLPNATQTANAKSLDVDALELMLRVFDREGLLLLPALDLSSTVDQLESIRRTSDPQTSGLEWVGADGRTWLESIGAAHGRAPYYNLLDQRVQQAVLDRVQSLADHCGKHAAFGGVALQLNGEGFAVLPSLDWGFDDATLRRFEHDTGNKLPAEGSNRFAARHDLLTGQYAAAWRDWRTSQLTAFYARLAAAVRGNSDRRLVFTTEKLFTGERASAMRPTLLGNRPENRIETALLEAGIDRQALERLPGVLFSPTNYVGPKLPLPDHANDYELNDAFAALRRPSTPSASRAAMLYHPPVRQRLTSFEGARIPWRLNGEMQLASEMSPQGDDAHRPLLQALLAHDPEMLIDGGEQLPLGGEDTLRQTRAIIAQLPLVSDVSDSTKQPIVVRTYGEGNRTTLVAMNLSPWRANAQVVLELPQAASLELLGPTADAVPPPASLSLPAGRQTWTLALAPYELRAVRAPVAGIKVAEIQSTPNDVANSELAAVLTELNNRDLTAPRIYPVLSNPSFEPLSAGVSGWHLAAGDPNTLLELDPISPQDGKTSLHMRCNAPGAKISSDRLPAPPTGQLAMTVYARGRNLGPNAELRLVVEIEDRAYRSATVRAADLQRQDGSWGRAFAVLVPDLPLDSHGGMRIAFELSGTGDLWLDNVKLYDLLFPLNLDSNAQVEVFRLSTQIHAAKTALDNQQIVDCQRILEDYWSRFILAYRPPVQPKQLIAAGPTSATPASPPQPNQGQEPAPGFGDRIKRIVPIFR